MKKKYFALLLSIALIVSFVGCGGQTDTSSSSVATASVASTSTESDKVYHIGLVQLVEHPSLDEIRTAFTEQLTADAQAQGYTVQIDYKNAQNDMSLINSICREFVNDKVDVIVAIATPSAQGAASVTTDIPIIFSAVTDPVSAGLVENMEQPEGNITGTSDYIDVDKIFDLADELTPGISTYGFIYNKGESNSVSVIEQAKLILDQRGISYVEKNVTTTGEVQQASRVLLEECDAIFAPIDNTVASAMAVLAQEAIQQNKPVYVAADSMVNDGGLATVGVNYTQLGKQTANMTLQVLEGTPISQLPVEVLSDPSVVVNNETAEALGIDVSDYVS